ncbi:MAG: type II secretion system F family protein [Halobacteriota archaeon]|nr:type II secretion system F family protein [Halobacteriota archaeon]
MSELKITGKGANFLDGLDDDKFSEKIDDKAKRKGLSDENVLQRIDAPAIKLFGRWAEERRERYSGLKASLRQAHIPKTVETYVSYVYFYTFLIAVVGGVAGGCLFYFALSHKGIFLLIMALSLPIILSFFTYRLLMWYPSFKASVRRTGIDASLPYSVAYMHAMSKGGMNIIDIFKSLSEHTHIFMDAAEEVEFIVRDMTFFGMDVMNALYNAGERTPSGKFKDFIDSLITVIDSGGDITAYFASKSEQYQSDALEEQKSYLDTLGMVAESYVTAFVAGPLFMITILIVMGIAGSGSSRTIEMIIYILVPVGSVMFIILLSIISISDKEGSAHTYVRSKELDEYDDVLETSLRSEYDDALFKELMMVDKRARMEKMLKDPFKHFYEKPSHSIFFSAPVSILYLVFVVLTRSPAFALDSVSRPASGIAFSTGTGIIDILDGPIVITILILLAPFTLFYEMRRMKIRKIESAIPNFLKRLASTNEAGITLSRAIGMLADSNLGILSSEIKIIWKDISWGRGTTESLVKFERRVKTTAISRTITLITRASEATGNIREVLSIAAKDSEIGERLKRARSADMSTYMILIYISFIVFLVILYILSSSFLTILPDDPEMTSNFKIPEQSFDVELYNRLFFHAAVIQGFFSGLIAGEMGEGSGYAGIKHSVIMVAIAYVVFNFVIG